MTRPEALPDVAARAAAGDASPQELLDALLTAPLWFEAPTTPGVMVAGTPSGPVVCAFTSLQQLAAARGAVAWASCTGADLLGLLPDGVDLLLDPAGPHPLRLRTAALRRAVHVA